MRVRCEFGYAPQHALAFFVREADTTSVKTAIFAIVLLASLRGAARAETVEMTTGPRVVVNYEPAVWKPLAPLGSPQPGTTQSMTWALQQPEWAQITVRSGPERQDDAEFKRGTLDAQKFRGDPAELVRERRDSIAGKEWLVLEFRNAHTRPSRSEIHYFLPAAEGTVSLFVICDESSLSKHRQAIDAFFRKIALK